MKSLMSFEMLICGQSSIAAGIRTRDSFGRYMGLFMRRKMASFHVIFVALVTLEGTLLLDKRFRIDTSPVWVLMCSCRRQGLVYDLSHPSKVQG